MGSTVFIADYYYVQPILTTHQMLGIIIFIVIATSFLELFTANENSTLNISSTFAGILFVPVLLGTSIDIRQYDLLMSTNLTFALVILFGPVILLLLFLEQALAQKKLCHLLAQKNHGWDP